MKLQDDFHQLHYDAIKFEGQGVSLPSHLSMKGSKQKLYKFKNGYGASVVQGSFTGNFPELAVIWFHSPVFYRSKKKRFKKKILKQSGNFELDYSTPIADDVKRYDSIKELQKDLNRIANLKPCH